MKPVVVTFANCEDHVFENLIGYIEGCEMFPQVLKKGLIEKVKEGDITFDIKRLSDENGAEFFMSFLTTLASCLALKLTELHNDYERKSINN